jgi:hypothetical protein
MMQQHWLITFIFCLSLLTVLQAKVNYLVAVGQGTQLSQYNQTVTAVASFTVASNTQELLLLNWFVPNDEFQVDSIVVQIDSKQVNNACIKDYPLDGSLVTVVKCKFTKVEQVVNVQLQLRNTNRSWRDTSTIHYTIAGSELASVEGDLLYQTDNSKLPQLSVDVKLQSETQVFTPSKVIALQFSTGNVGIYDASQVVVTFKTIPAIPFVELENSTMSGSKCSIASDKITARCTYEQLSAGTSDLYKKLLLRVQDSAKPDVNYALEYSIESVEVKSRKVAAVALPVILPRSKTSVCKYNTLFKSVQQQYRYGAGQKANLVYTITVDPSSPLPFQSGQILIALPIGLKYQSSNNTCVTEKLFNNETLIRCTIEKVDIGKEHIIQITVLAEPDEKLEIIQPWSHIWNINDYTDKSQNDMPSQRLSALEQPLWIEKSSGSKVSVDIQLDNPEIVGVTSSLLTVQVNNYGPNPTGAIKLQLAVPNKSSNLVIARIEDQRCHGSANVFNCSFDNLDRGTQVLVRAIIVSQKKSGEPEIETIISVAQIQEQKVITSKGIVLRSK